MPPHYSLSGLRRRRKRALSLAAIEARSIPSIGKSSGSRPGRRLGVRKLPKGHEFEKEPQGHEKSSNLPAEMTN